MAEGGDDGKRRCVLDVVGAQGLQSYLKGALGAARAEAGRARVRQYVEDELECADMSAADGRSAALHEQARSAAPHEQESR